MTFVTAYPEEAVLEAAALQVGLEFLVNMLGQGFALLGQEVHQGRVVRLNDLIEEGLLGLMALVGRSAKAIPALCQHGGSALETRKIERTSLYWEAG